MEKNSPITGKKRPADTNIKKEAEPNKKRKNDTGEEKKFTETTKTNIGEVVAFAALNRFLDETTLEVDVLKVQNKELCCKLLEQKQVVASLTEEAEKINQVHTKAKLALDFIDSRWAQFYEDLKVVLHRVDSTQSLQESQINTEKSTKINLLHLLQSEDTGSDGEASIIEHGIQSQLEQIKSIFLLIVEATEKEKEYSLKIQNEMRQPETSEERFTRLSLSHKKTLRRS